MPPFCPTTRYAGICSGRVDTSSLLPFWCGDVIAVALLVLSRCTPPLLAGGLSDMCYMAAGAIHGLSTHSSLLCCGASLCCIGELRFAVPIRCLKQSAIHFLFALPSACLLPFFSGIEP